ncbi:hypothetical protein Q9L58_003977 [Maublancomyces gigas]|uniref:Uncharacterized protein n=1 Tax=Discina gigas TaxID=1032678 RepID=A0ABR3GM47_9PEZI
MSMKNHLYRQYRTIIDLWPIDPLRPLAFQTFLRDRSAKQFGLHVGREDAVPTQNGDALSTTGNKGMEEGKPVVEFNTVGAVGELNALQTLLENRYLNMYPITETLLKPKGNPNYYENLLKELEKAPERSWLQAKMNSWKGYIRMK